MKVKSCVAHRVREVRIERFGVDGVDRVAEILGVPGRTWENYESGVTMPAEYVLGFIQATGVSPSWLLTGEGPRYQLTLSAEPPSN